MLLTQAIQFPDWLPNGFQIGPLFLSFYGLSYVLSFLFCYAYSTRQCRNKPIWAAKGVPSGTMPVPNKFILEDYMFYIILGVLLGGRIGYILLYGIGGDTNYLENPLEIFKVWKGGMSFHGGFLGVALAVWYMSRKHKVPLMRLADIAALSTPIALGLVRLANFINQELYGRTTDVAWAMIFTTDPDRQPRHPSQLYEAFLEGFVLWMIIRIASHRFGVLSRPGFATGLFIGGYGTFRFIIEFFREPDRIPQISEHFTRGMAYSLPMILVGAFLIWRAMRYPEVAPKFMVEAEPKKAKSKA